MKKKKFINLNRDRQKFCRLPKNAQNNSKTA